MGEKLREEESKELTEPRLPIEDLRAIEQEALEKYKKAGIKSSNHPGDKVVADETDMAFGELQRASQERREAEEYERRTRSQK